MIEQGARAQPDALSAPCIQPAKGTPHVADIRNYGLAAGLTIAAHAWRAGQDVPMKLPWRCWEKGFYVRYGGDTIQIAPPFISTPEQIDAMINALGETLQRQP
jgi:beta-alanine--pyruvate transaminase